MTSFVSCSPCISGVCVVQHCVTSPLCNTATLLHERCDSSHNAVLPVCRTLRTQTCARECPSCPCMSRVFSIALPRTLLPSRKSPKSTSSGILNAMPSPHNMSRSSSPRMSRAINVSRTFSLSHKQNGSLAPTPRVVITLKTLTRVKRGNMSLLLDDFDPADQVNPVDQVNHVDQVNSANRVAGFHVNMTYSSKNMTYSSKNIISSLLGTSSTTNYDGPRRRRMYVCMYVCLFVCLFCVCVMSECICIRSVCAIIVYVPHVLV